mmetsp:Transcript_250/g.460  ORF Transcript_250/g.460 Transcript_250/m.460 type:complete len:794 (-) Transcript_250:716-3097(-)
MRLASLLATVAAAEASFQCFSGSSPSAYLGEGRHIKIEQNDWLGHAVSTQTAAIVLREIMGFNVTVVETPMTWSDPNDNPLSRLRDEKVDANLEGWRIDWPADLVEAYLAGGSVDNSVHEFQGRVGVYTQRFVVDDNPELFADYWRSYRGRDVLQLFDNPNSTFLNEKADEFGPNCDGSYGCKPGKGVYVPPRCEPADANCVPMYHVFPDYATGWVEQLINNLALNISVYYSGGEVYDLIRSQNAIKQAAMFYSWRPHEFLAGDDYVRITFPEKSQECVDLDTFNRTGGRDCDQDGEPVYKFKRTSLRRYSLAAVQFLEAYSLRLQDQNTMLAATEAGGQGGTLTVEEASCEWLQNHESIWRSWVPNISVPLCNAILQGDIQRYPASFEPILQKCFEVTQPVEPCRATGCGKYAECPDDGDDTLCECSSSDTQKAQDFAVSRSCEPTVASTDQQRVFWTLSMFLFSIGFVLTCIVINEFVYNPVLNDSVMRMFLAITVPDLVLSSVYFIFHFINLLNGQEMDTGPCEFFAIITTGVVYATFFGPPIVALATLYMFFMAIKGYPSWKPSKMKTALLCVVPWIFGITIGFVVLAEGSLGSYRGLLCYNSEWDSYITGGLTLTMFCLSTAVTILAYLGTAYIAFAAGKRSSKRVAIINGVSVLKRGAALVGTFFCTWALFMVAVIINMTSDPPPLTFEMIASLCISAQPIVDAFVLLSTPVVRREMFARLNRQWGDRTSGRSIAGGGSSSSSSSCTSSAYGSSSCQPPAASKSQPAAVTSPSPERTAPEGVKTEFA